MPMPSTLPPARTAPSSPLPPRRPRRCRRASPLGGESWTASRSWTRSAVARVHYLGLPNVGRCFCPTTSARLS
eukprot:8646463-Pyramimonas_sp.AAC.1